jgi:hypothetical protein
MVLGAIFEGRGYLPSGQHSNSSSGSTAARKCLKKTTLGRNVLYTGNMKIARKRIQGGVHKLIEN